MTASGWVSKGFPLWVIVFRRASALIFCMWMCGIAAVRIQRLWVPDMNWVWPVLFVLFMFTLESCFWEWAKTRMDMFVVSDWQDQGKFRTTFVKLFTSEFFVPDGKEILIRNTADGKSVEVLTGDAGENDA
jgi:hypothetical protein